MFEVGRNLAITPGKVIFQNELMQLIQYAPSTETVLKRPLLIVPPWINKYYVLDLTPEKSFIKWCVDQGLTVFCISWVNPDARLAQKSFEDYMREGPLAALDAIKQATGEDKVHAIGYCVGGTLLGDHARPRWRPGTTSASCRRRCSPPRSTSPMPAISRCSSTRSRSRRWSSGWPSAAISKARSMATVFNLLRSNDLIWPYVINNYLKGKAPFPFDLLYWNSDATRMPAANHSFYMRNCYLDNRLAKGKMVIGNTPIDLKAIKMPIYNLATREDHIAPAKSVLLGSKLFGGDGANSCCPAPAISPAWSIRRPSRNINTGPGRRPRSADLDGWLGQGQGASRLMVAGLARLAHAAKPDRSARAEPGDGALKPIEDAPGSYVKVRD